MKVGIKYNNIDVVSIQMLILFQAFLHLSMNDTNFTGIKKINFELFAKDNDKSKNITYFDNFNH